MNTYPGKRASGIYLSTRSTFFDLENGRLESHIRRSSAGSLDQFHHVLIILRTVGVELKERWAERQACVYRMSTSPLNTSHQQSCIEARRCTDQTEAGAPQAGSCCERGTARGVIFRRCKTWQSRCSAAGTCADISDETESRPYSEAHRWQYSPLDHGHHCPYFTHREGAWPGATQERRGKIP